MAFNHDFMGYLSPDKPITTGGRPLGYTALDFWRFQFSNIWDLYDEVAEYLVSKALGIEEPCNKNGSPLWDINYRDKRIEVKSSAKYHSWQVKGNVSKNNVFGIQKTKPQDAETDEDKIPKRHNDVYVFCLSIGENQLDADPFETDHWVFYVVPTSVINRECGDNKTITIGRIKSLVQQEKEGALQYNQLKAAIDAALDAGNYVPDGPEGEHQGCRRGLGFPGAGDRLGADGTYHQVRTAGAGAGRFESDLQAGKGSGE